MEALLTVNGEAVSVAEAVRNSLLYTEKFLENRIFRALVRQYAEQHKITVSDEELQAYADAHRYQRGLESAERAKQWIQRNHLTTQAVLDGMENLLLQGKIMRSIPDSEVDAYFAEHQLDFDWVELYSIRLEDGGVAEELYAQITEDGENFHVLAMEYSTDAETKHLGGYVGKLARSDMIGEIEAAVFSAQPGDVIGPIKTERGYNLFKVASVHKATLAAVFEQIRDHLFRDLFARLEAEATITYPVLES